MVKTTEIKTSKNSNLITQNCESTKRGLNLERKWVIANHKLVSFHAAFISSVLNLPPYKLSELAEQGANLKIEVLRFIFASWETVVSVIILYLSWHIGIAIHEMGHFLTAVELTALNKNSQEKADAVVKRNGGKFGWYAQMFLLIPWGRFYGVKKENGNFAPDAPYNLAVAAAAPVWSQWLATIFLPIAIIGITGGLLARGTFGENLIYVGRFFLAPGCAGLMDRLFADQGKLREFRAKEKISAQQAHKAPGASKES
jgi:hypothetical protein